MDDATGNRWIAQGVPWIMAGAMAWAAGLCAGAWIGGTWGWLAGAGVLGGICAWGGLKSAKQRAAGGRALVTPAGSVGWLVVIALVGAGWWGLWQRAGNMERGLGQTSVLMDVEGVIVEGPVVETEEAKGLGKFVFTHPRTRWVVAVSRVYGGDPGQAADGMAGLEVSGRLLVSLRAVDTRFGAGDRVRCRGWAAGLGEPMNMGESDSAATLRRAGIVGRMWLRDRANMQLVESGESSWRAIRERWVDKARRALDAGIAKTPESNAEDMDAVAFIDALVVGRRRAELDEVYPAFRMTGLAHALSISGLHVGLVAMVAWMVVMIATGKPRWAATVALLAVMGYVGMVPWKVPIVRAGFMTAAYCVGLMWNRRIRAASVLGWIALLWLVMRPGDLFDAGFLLSYGVVAGLLLWTDRVGQWMLPTRWWSAEEETWIWPVRRWAVRYVSAGIVAWGVALPIVAWKFGMINPLAVGIGAVMLPMLAAVLWLGLLKVAVGLIVPGAGAAMSGTLMAMGKLCVGMVRWLSKQPGAAVELGTVSGWWAAAAMMFVTALLSGWFKGRRAAMVACVVVLAVGLFGGIAKMGATISEPLRCTALAVGDGSCFVVRSGDATWLFDCGSGQRRNVGERVVAAALEAMGVRRVDTIVLSHGDFDHFSGTLEVCDALPVGRIVTGAGLMRDAEQQPRGATAALVEGLRARHVPIEVISAGWRDRMGEAQVEAVWPPEGVTFETNNDGSVVLRFTVATRGGDKRLMLNGDIQGLAMSMMRQRATDVRADVTDLPHHGSFPPGVLGWLASVQPEVLIQSTGPRKLNWDKWAGHAQGMQRLITARLGAVTVHFEADGAITTDHFAKAGNAENPMDEPTDAVSNDSR